MTRVAAENPFALHAGAAETWAFIEERVLENGLVDGALKELCFMYITDPDAANTFTTALSFNVTATSLNFWRGLSYLRSQQYPSAVADFYLERVEPLIATAGPPPAKPARRGEPVMVYLRGPATTAGAG